MAEYSSPFSTRAKFSAATSIAPNTIEFYIPTSTAARYTATTTATSKNYVNERSLFLVITVTSGNNNCLIYDFWQE